MAPWWRVRATLTNGVVAGITIVAGMPSRAAWRATACAWLPADTATTPHARSSGVNASSRFRAPRSLNDAVNWSTSAFTTTVHPRISDSVWDSVARVRTTAPLIATAAASTSSTVTARSVIVARGLRPRTPSACGSLALARPP
jgi:hypothetical protein